MTRIRTPFDEPKELLLIGNGFDLACGIPTRYIDFIQWYIYNSAIELLNNGEYEDELIQITSGKNLENLSVETLPKSAHEIIELFDSRGFNNSRIDFKSGFFQRLVRMFSNNNWVDIEQFYFKSLTNIFESGLLLDKKIQDAEKLNKNLNHIIKHLTRYIEVVNSNIPSNLEADFVKHNTNLSELFFDKPNNTYVLNFNYTDTLQRFKSFNSKDFNHIHGRIADCELNPIVFGYGDETLDVYQAMEDINENIFLEHMKSFAYFQNNNYKRLISFIDTNIYNVNIIGHSCGLSDRILLSEIFESENCNTINVYYYLNENGLDNYKTITQQISRHFSKNNKKLMRRKIQPKENENFLPQLKKIDIKF